VIVSLMASALLRTENALSHPIIIERESAVRSAVDEEVSSVVYRTWRMVECGYEQTGADT